MSMESSFWSKSSVFLVARIWYNIYNLKNGKYTIRSSKMKKKLLGLTCFAVALCATVGGTVALNASADVDGSSWYLRDDGY